MTTTAESVEISDPATIEETMLHNLSLSLGDMAEEMVYELAPMFIEDAKDNLTQIHQAIGAGNCAQVSKLAHTLKGSSGNMGLLHFSSMCASVMQAARSDDLTSVRSWWPKLIAEYKCIHQVLLKYSNQ